MKSKDATLFPGFGINLNWLNGLTPHPLFQSYGVPELGEIAQE
jgi:hypothetical protein